MVRVRNAPHSRDFTSVKVAGRLDRVALTTACLSFVSRVQIGDAL